MSFGSVQSFEYMNRGKKAVICTVCRKKKCFFTFFGGKVKLKRMQASKPLAKALRALAKALSISSARNSSLSEPKANSEERS